MKIENNVYMLEIPVKIEDMRNTIYPTILCDNNSLILVDTGYPKQLELIKENIKREGLDFNNLKSIILTHHDIDHIGNALALIKQIPQKVKVLSHIDEEKYLNGEIVPMKLDGLDVINMGEFPKKLQELYISLKRGFQKCRIKPDITLKDEEELPYLGGIIVIHTPGHTKGHISLYIKKYKILIAGDTLTIRDGKLSLVDANLHYNSILNKKSVAKFLNYDIEKIICYHGGLFTGNIKESIKAII